MDVLIQLQFGRIWGDFVSSESPFCERRKAPQERQNRRWSSVGLNENDNEKDMPAPSSEGQTTKQL